MKKLILLTISLCIAIILCLSACGGKQKYYIYTNIPSGGYQLCDQPFTIGGEIEGYNESSQNSAEDETEGFTSKSRLYYVMTTDAQLVISANFSKEGEEERYTNFTKEVSAQLNAVDKALSATVKNSDIDRFNCASAGETLEISLITYEVLTIAKQINALTEGFYNPALYYNITAYGFGSAHDYPETAADLPKDSDIEKYVSLAARFNEIALSEAEEKYYVTKPDFSVEVNGETLSMRLDLGGIGKGYAVDKIDLLFNKYGYKYGYFNFGSSSMLVKSNYQSGEYQLGITSPRSPQRNPYMIVPARDAKLSTSGDNEQFYLIDGVRYCHIIDAATGKPVQKGVMSATVIGGSAAEDDALTTAIMAMGKDKAVKFIAEKLTDRKVVFTCE